MLYSRAKTFHKTPSELLYIRNQWLAYQFDECVNYYGSWVDGKLAQRDKKGKPRHTIESILNKQSKAVSITALLEASDADVIDI